MITDMINDKKEQQEKALRKFVCFTAMIGRNCGDTDQWTPAHTNINFLNVASSKKKQQVDFSFETCVLLCSPAALPAGALLGPDPLRLCAPSKLRKEEPLGS